MNKHKLKITGTVAANVLYAGSPEVIEARCEKCRLTWWYDADIIRKLMVNIPQPIVKYWWPHSCTVE